MRLQLLNKGSNGEKRKLKMKQIEGKTKMTVRTSAPEGEEGDDMLQGWNEFLDNVAEDLKKK